MKILSKMFSVVTAVGLMLTASNATALHNVHKGNVEAATHYGEITETTALDLHVTMEDTDSQNFAYHTSHRSHYSHSSHSSHQSHSSHYSSRY